MAKQSTSRPARGSLDAPDISPLLDALEGNIDNLESALQPLVENALTETTSKLPLLDKAKLYVLVTYAIESMLFSYLRLNGTNAKEHAVFRELARTKQYFEKIRKAEEPEKKSKLTLDKDAARRFVVAGTQAAPPERARTEEMKRRKDPEVKQAEKKARRAKKLQKRREEKGAKDQQSEPSISLPSSS